MKKVAALVLLLATLGSCEEPAVDKTQRFEEEIVDFAIQQKNGRAIEVKDLYDSLTHTIPDDAEEKLILAEILKKKGFEVINWSRGNFFHGPRVVVLTLQKADCQCNVAKFYYSEYDDSTYLRTESISCR